MGTMMTGEVMKWSACSFPLENKLHAIFLIHSSTFREFFFIHSNGFFPMTFLTLKSLSLSLSTTVVFPLSAGAITIPLSDKTLHGLTFPFRHIRCWSFCPSKYATNLCLCYFRITLSFISPRTGLTTFREGEKFRPFSKTACSEGDSS